MTENLIIEHPDLVGLFISGAMNALRRYGKSGKIIGLKFKLTDNTRSGLLDSTLTKVLGHSLERLVQETIGGMLRAIKLGIEADKQITILPFDPYTCESV